MHPPGREVCAQTGEYLYLAFEGPETRHLISIEGLAHVEQVPSGWVHLNEKFGLCVGLNHFPHSLSETVSLLELCVDPSKVDEGTPRQKLGEGAMWSLCEGLLFVVAEGMSSSVPPRLRHEFELGRGKVAPCPNPRVPRRGVQTDDDRGVCVDDSLRQGVGMSVIHPF